MIREATADDRPALVSMAQHFLRATPYGRWTPATTTQIEALIQTVLALGVILVSERETFLKHPGDSDWKFIVGMLALVEVEHPMTGQRYAEEIAWWVEPEHRGGVGLRLHAAAERWARSRKLGVIKMIAPVGTDLGVYYRRFGYLEVETHYMKLLD